MALRAASLDGKSAVPPAIGCSRGKEIGSERQVTLLSQPVGYGTGPIGEAAILVDDDNGGGRVADFGINEESL